MRVFASYSVKGGVGKTTSSVNLAYVSALRGARTLLWDLDPQGAATFYFRVKPKVKGGGRRLLRSATNVDRCIRGTDYEGLDLLPSDFSYRHLDLDLDAVKKPKQRLRRVLDKLAANYDHVFLDCAPSISLVSESVFRAADVLLVPTIPTTLSIRTLEQLTRALDRKARDGALVLPFFCMADARKRMHREIIDEPQRTPFPFLKTVIPYASVVENMGVHREPLLAFSPRSNASQAYTQLWDEILARDAERPAVRLLVVPEQEPRSLAPPANPPLDPKRARRAARRGTRS